MDIILANWVCGKADVDDLAIALEMSGGSRINEILTKTTYQAILEKDYHITQVWQSFSNPNPNPNPHPNPHPYTNPN